MQNVVITPRAARLALLALAAAACTAEPPGPAVEPPVVESDPALLRLRYPLPDTVYGRSLTLIGEYPGEVHQYAPLVELVIDPESATPRVSRRIDWNNLVGPRVDSAGLPGFRVDVDGSLANGPHRFELRRLGEKDSVLATVRGHFVIHVGDVDYRLDSLATLGGDAAALDVNASGDVAGWARDADGQARAVVWRGGQLVRLPMPVGAIESSAGALNDAGVVAGQVRDTTIEWCTRPAVWNAEGVRVIAVPRRACARARAVDVNAAGNVLIEEPSSVLSEYATPRGAWLERDGLLMQLAMSYPKAINVAGQIIGSYTLPGLYTYGAAAIGLTYKAVGARGSGGHPVGSLEALNDRAQVAGTNGGYRYYSRFVGDAAGAVDVTASLGGPTANVSLVALTNGGTLLAFDADEHIAMLWQAIRTRRVRVTTPGWRLEEVAAINETGVVVGRATEVASGRTVPVRLTPQ